MLCFSRNSQLLNEARLRVLQEREDYTKVIYNLCFEWTSFSTVILFAYVIVTNVKDYM